MTYDNQVAQAVPSAATMRRATVVDARTDGVVVAQSAGADDGAIAHCDVLASVASERLAVGDEVIIWTGTDPAARPVVIGRIAHGMRQPTDQPEQAELAETLVLEAKHSLTLRVGDGSIVIREDGKILIKGKDLVSHAQRMNRIKGGAVSIN
jgi:hypothetical protein